MQAICVRLNHLPRSAYRIALCLDSAFWRIATWFSVCMCVCVYAVIRVCNYSPFPSPILYSGLLAFLRLRYPTIQPDAAAVLMGPHFYCQDSRDGTVSHTDLLCVCVG